jgi:hypothetical protein
VALAVVAGTTVAALSPPGTAARAAPAPLASAEVGSPAVASLTEGRVDVFSRGTGGNLAYQYRLPGGSWTRTLSLGGVLTSQPAATSWAPGRMDVFARGGDNALWHRSLSGGVWSGWGSLGGRLSSAPAVTSQASGLLDVFVRGSDGALWRKSFVAGQGWSSWSSLGGVLTSSPAAASSAAGRLDVFVRGADNAVWHRPFSGGVWSGWRSLGGRISAQPAAARGDLGPLDVVGRGTDNALWVNRYLGDRWTGWTSLGGGFLSGPSAALTGDHVTVVGKGNNGFFYGNRLRSGTPSGWSIVDPYQPFRRLGTWVDVFDYAALDPQTAVADMRARGVRVLYLSTGRFNSAADFYDAVEAGQWLDAAHAAGIRVVGWYVPAYDDVARDVRRTVAIANFVSPGGQRFDAVGVDIERLGPGVTRDQFNTRLVTHLTQVRAQIHAVIGAIVPSPYGTDPGGGWPGFPWAAVGQRSEVVVPMALWSFRTNFTPDQVYSWVLDQVRRARSLSGRPVSVEGGVAGEGSTPVTADRVDRFVDAVTDGGAIGGSNYDYLTTSAAFWPILTRLNAL